MDRLREDKEKVKLERKLKNAGRGDYISKIESMMGDALEAELLKLSKYNQEMQTVKKNDDKLIEAQDLVKELNRPYNEALSMNKNMQRLVALVMEEKGKL